MPSPTSQPAIVLDDVRIRHAEATVPTPDGVTATVRRGEVLLVLGPSGCGKSTLVLALNGLIPHAVETELTGSVAVDGIDTTATTVARLSEHVAMVFQDPDAQIVTGSVLDEVCFGPENLLVDRAEVVERAEHALRRVGLWERRLENPDRLSGGGKQRLAIACALAMRTPTIVLDEPTANLDPAGIDDVYAALRDLAATRDHAIVLVEHNLDAAIDLVDRILVLDRTGRSVIDGPAREVLTDRIDDLLALGVWVPTSVIAALELRAAGVPIDPLPLSPAELTAALDHVDQLPDPLSRALADAVTGSTNTATTTATSTDADVASAPPPAITVDRLSLTRGTGRARVPVLHDVSLRIPSGSFTAITGVNGAGKTTLLQAIAGVLPSPRGRIGVSGLDPATADARDLARTIGFVFQNPEHQFIRGSVEEELRHGLEIQGVADEEIRERVDRMLDRLDLSALRDRHPFLLSGGQKRRLSVATALIAGARILALDEPTFGQDRERANELLDILRELVADGTTVLVVTHDMQLVADYATHVAVLRDGRLLSHATVAETLAGDALVEAGLRLPPLARAMRGVTGNDGWRAITRLDQLRSLVADDPVGGTA